MDINVRIRFLLLSILLVSPVVLGKTGTRLEDSSQLQQEPQRLQQEQQKITESSNEQVIEKKDEENPIRVNQQEEQQAEKWEQTQMQTSSAERKTRLESEFKPSKGTLTITKLEEPPKSSAQRAEQSQLVQIQQNEQLVEASPMKGSQRSEEQLEKKEQRKEEPKQVKIEEQQREQPTQELTKELPRRVEQQQQLETKQEQQQIESKQEQQSEEQIEEREPVRVSEELPAPIKSIAKEQVHEELIPQQAAGKGAISQREPLLKSQVFASEPELYAPATFGYRASDFRVNESPLDVYGPVRGHYSLQSPDGYSRRLEYFADRSGFRIHLEPESERYSLSSNVVLRSYQQRPDEITLRLEPAYVPVTRAAFFDRKMAPARLTAEPQPAPTAGLWASKLEAKGGRLIQQQQLPATTENLQSFPIKSESKLAHIKQEWAGELKQQHRAIDQPIRLITPTFLARPAAVPALRPAQLVSGSWKGAASPPIVGRRHYLNPMLVQLYPVGAHTAPVGPRPLFPPTPVESSDFDRGFERSD